MHHLRILERFPIVGRDLTEKNLAPEADRNSTAISYNKGCYLGQEPIARIDAMGHVNNKLFGILAESVEQQSATVTPSDENADQNQITSISDIGSQTRLALIQLRVNKAAEMTHAVTADGQTMRIELVSNP